MWYICYKLILNAGYMFLKNMGTLNRLPFKARKAVFEKLEKIVDIASLSKEEREKYDESIKVYRDHLVTLAYAREEGRAEGRAEGLEEGLEKGKLEIARTMLADGLSLTMIMKYTGLSAEEIKKLTLKE